MENEQDVEIFEFPVLWQGWSCDAIAWIMKRPDGTLYLRMTINGTPYEEAPDAMYEHIAKYEQAIIKTQEAIELLKVGPNKI